MGARMLARSGRDVSLTLARTGTERATSAPDRALHYSRARTLPTAQMWRTLNIESKRSSVVVTRP